MTTGMFYGVGVGPGPKGLLPVAAVEALRSADVILAPKAKHVQMSIARQCLAGLDLDESRIRDLVHNMEADRSATLAHYKTIAAEIGQELAQGRNVAYLTIGDSLTYSTYSCTLGALLEFFPDLQHKTFPGITSYAAIAAALGWPLGQGKERVLILPCPDDPTDLRYQLKTHDIVVLIKIGARLPIVLSTLKELRLEGEFGFGSRIGLSGELVSNDIADLETLDSNGYLMTMLIRNPRAEVVRA